MSTPLLGLRQASFGYSGKSVLRGVDFELGAADYWAIAGPNGAGKTTLFRGILGSIRPSAGRVERPHCAIGYVPQRETLDALYPLQVIEVVEMGGFARLSRLARRLPTNHRPRVLEALARVDLLDQAHVRFSALSGGQRQRALIARALLVEPHLLLLDEPTSGVDRATREQILELLDELNRRSGISILLVSHDLLALRERVSRILWVEGGCARLLDVEEALRLWSASESADLEPAEESPWT